METFLIFIVFGLYIFIRVMLGGGLTDYEKKLKKHQAGLALLKLKKYQDAHNFFDLVLEKEPNDAVALGLRAEAACKLSQLENALIDSSRAIALDHSFPSPYLTKAHCLFAYNEFEEALKQVNKAIWYQRNNPSAYLLRGKIWLKKGQEALASEDLIEAYKQGEEEAFYLLSGQSKKRLRSPK